jgi:hypothetical protein
VSVEFLNKFGRIANVNDEAVFPSLEVHPTGGWGTRNGVGRCVANQSHGMLINRSME